MATLPDLDTSDIGYVAYWNAIEQGTLTELDPTSAAVTDNLEVYDEYENGVQGITILGVSGKKNRDAYLRVKDDGWIVCWIDRSESTDQAVRSGSVEADNIYGPFDILSAWGSSGAAAPVENNGLAGIIQGVANSLEANLTDQGNVGLYNYETPSATNITSIVRDAQGGATIEITPTSSTNLHQYYMTGAAQNDDGTNTENPGNVYHDVNGLNINIGGNAHSTYLGAVNALNKGTASPGYTTVDSISNDASAQSLIAWS